MKFTVTVLYDNESIVEGLRPDWGFAALVESAKGPPVLFDTGADGRTLLYNASRLDVDVSAIGAIVISHWHWDHAGGLPLVLKKAGVADLYAPAVASEHVPEERLHIVGGNPVEIVPGVYSTGVLDGMEQSLVLTGDQGGFVIMGCAHPGVKRLLAAARSISEPYALLGGLHGFSDLSALEALDVVYPGHCTQRTQEILERYPDKAHRCGAGLVVTT